METFRRALLVAGLLDQLPLGDLSRVSPVCSRRAAMARAATLASDECGTALSIQHFSSRRGLREKCFWRTMQSQQSDGVSGVRRPALEPVIEVQAVWTD